MTKSSWQTGRTIVIADAYIDDSGADSNDFIIVQSFPYWPTVDLVWKKGGQKVTLFLVIAPLKSNKVTQG